MLGGQLDINTVLLGWRKRWLNAYEISLSAGLLLIPYVTRGYDFGMCSQGRFAAVCFPMYLVMGRLLAAMPTTWRAMPAPALRPSLTGANQLG
jgi:hypothetical protein